MPDISEIKTILRSLLISKGSRDVTIRQLNSLYREIEDCNIPFRDFNYTSLEAFLLSMPDTLRLMPNRNYEICAYHIDTEKSIHVSSLVARQKKPPRRAKSACNYRPQTNHYLHPRPLLNMYKPPPIDILSQVLQELKNSSTRIPNRGIRKFDVLSRVRERMPRNAPYTVEDLNFHLRDFFHKLIIEDDFIYFKDEMEKSKASNHVINNKSVPSSNRNDTGLVNGYNKNQNVNAYNNDTGSASSNVKSNVINNCNGTNNASNLNITDKMINNCNGIDNFDKCNNIDKVISNSNGTNDFGNCNGADKVISNSNGTDDFGNCNSADKVIGNCNGDVTKAKVRSHSNSSNNDEQKSVLADKSTEHEIIRERTKIRLQKLLENHPEGIWCSELPSIYKSEYNLELEYNDLGFTSITEFVAALPNIFDIVEPPNTNKQMVLDARKSSKMPNSQSKTLASHYNFDDYVKNDPDPVPTKLSSEVCRMLIPEGVMNLNETVDLIMVNTLTCEEYIEVNLSEIFTPSFFWITLRKNKKKIKTLMSDLGEFYTNQKLDSYRIPQVVLEPGLNVACVYAKKWHRGMVKKIKPDGYVMIFFYDYGTVKTYNPNDLYYLHKRFSTLPAQAIACGLFNVKPIGSISEWLRDPTSAFINKVWNIPLVAIISTMNLEQNTMMVTLTDTSDDLMDLHINDWMVDNQFAEWGKMVNSVEVHNLCMYDEDILIKKERKKDTPLKESYSSSYNLNANIKSEPLDNNESQSRFASLNGSSYYIDSFYDTSNVATLVKENMDLTKQTNTIAQAILLNMPVNKSTSSNDHQIDSKNVAMNNSTFNDNELDTKSCHSDYNNQGFAMNLNTNLKNLKIDISEMNNNTSENELIKTESEHWKQNTRDDFQRCSSTHSLYSQASSFGSKSVQNNNLDLRCKTTELKPLSNEYLERRSSINSTTSYFSSPDDPLIREDVSVYQTQPKGKYESDRISFMSGTPYYEIKIESPRTSSKSLDIKPKSNIIDIKPQLNGIDIKPQSNNTDIKPSYSINIKYPSNFSNMYMKSRKNCGNGNVDQNGSIKPKQREETDEGYNTGLTSTPQTHSNFSSATRLNVTSPIAPVYTATYLSERCDKKVVHIFHLYNEGWMCTSEFVDAFTNLKDQRVMFKLLEILDYKVNFKNLTRDTDPELFSQLDTSILRVPREKDKKIKSDFVLTLLPLKVVLQVLVKLDFLNSKMLTEALPLMKQYRDDAQDILYEKYNNKILYDSLNILVQYKEFRRLHKSIQ